MVDKLAGNQKVKIAIDDILEKYECPICMCKLNEPIIAKCGHTFCKVSYHSRKALRISTLDF